MPLLPRVREARGRAGAWWSVEPGLVLLRSLWLETQTETMHNMHAMDATQSEPKLHLHSPTEKHPKKCKFQPKKIK